jgi:hypothetical protein
MFYPVGALSTSSNEVSKSAEYKARQEKNTEQIKEGD